MLVAGIFLFDLFEACGLPTFQMLARVTAAFSRMGWVCFVVLQQPLGQLLSIAVLILSQLAELAFIVCSRGCTVMLANRKKSLIIVNNDSLYAIEGEGVPYR